MPACTTSKTSPLKFPRTKLVVLTGLSGSGKSTLAFDILHKEGQRQYMESLGMVTWGLAKAAGGFHRRPVPLHQRGPTPDESQPALDGGHGHRSLHLPEGLVRPPRTSPLPEVREGRAAASCSKSADGDWQDESDESPDGTYPCPHCGAAVPEMGMANFSFNKPAGACPTCTGSGRGAAPIISRLIDESKSIPENAVEGWIEFHDRAQQPDPAERGASISASSSTRPKPSRITRPSSATCCCTARRARSSAATSRTSSRPPPTRRDASKAWSPTCSAATTSTPTNAAYREKLDDLFTTQPCLDCEGTRLRPESRAVTVAGESIVTIAQLPLNDLDAWLKSLPPHFTAEEMLHRPPDSG